MTRKRGKLGRALDLRKGATASAPSSTVLARSEQPGKATAAQAVETGFPGRATGWREFWPALLSLLILQAAVSFSGAAQMDYVGNYDTAYYYAVARNVALGHWNSDTVLWHWLGTPDQVARPAGDYWSPGWPFLLGLAMRIVGHTMKHAMWICAFLSLSLPLLTFWAAYSIQPRILTAWLAGMVLIPQERLKETNFMPDIALSSQVFLMLGLCLLLAAERPGRFGRLRWVAAGAVLMVPFWLRGEGFLISAAAVVGTLLDGQVSYRERASRAGWLLIGSLACLLPFLGYNLWAFGSMTPKPRALVPFMSDFGDLYRFATDPSFESWRNIGPQAILGKVWDVLVKRAAQLLKEVPIPLLVLALLGSLVGGQRKILDARILTISLIIVTGWFVPAVMAPVPSDNPGRFVQQSTPLFCVLAALALDRLVFRWKAPEIVAGAAALAFLFSCSAWFWPLAMRNPLDRDRWKGGYTPIPSYLMPAGRPVLGSDDAVLTTDPWQVAAVLGVPAIMIPIDGPQAVNEVVARYHPRYLALPKKTLWVIVARGAGRQVLSGLKLRQAVASSDGTWYEILN